MFNQGRTITLCKKEGSESWLLPYRAYFVLKLCGFVRHKIKRCIICELTAKENKQ